MRLRDGRDGHSGRFGFRGANDAALLDAAGADEDFLDMTVGQNPGRLKVGHETALISAGNVLADSTFSLWFSFAGEGSSSSRTFPTQITSSCHGV